MTRHRHSTVQQHLDAHAGQDRVDVLQDALHPERPHFGRVEPQDLLPQVAADHLVTEQGAQHRQCGLRAREGVISQHRQRHRGVCRGRRGASARAQEARLQRLKERCDKVWGFCPQFGRGGFGGEDESPQPALKRARPPFTTQRSRCRQPRPLVVCMSFGLRFASPSPSSPSACKGCSSWWGQEEHGDVVSDRDCAAAGG